MFHALSSLSLGRLRHTLCYQQHYGPDDRHDVRPSLQGRIQRRAKGPLVLIINLYWIRICQRLVIDHTSLHAYAFGCIVNAP